jgi:hypothetical protein
MKFHYRLSTTAARGLVSTTGPGDAPSIQGWLRLAGSNEFIAQKKGEIRDVSG